MIYIINLLQRYIYFNLYFIFSRFDVNEMLSPINSTKLRYKIIFVLIYTTRMKWYYQLSLN